MRYKQDDELLRQAGHVPTKTVQAACVQVILSTPREETGSLWMRKFELFSNCSPLTIPWLDGIIRPQDSPRRYVLLQALKWFGSWNIIEESMNWKNACLFFHSLASALCMCVTVCTHVFVHEYNVQVSMSWCSFSRAILLQLALRAAPSYEDFVVLEKAEEAEIKLPISIGLSKKQESSRKISISALLIMPKPLTVWITTNCGKFWKRWKYQTTLPASCKTCMQVRKQQLELDMEQ